MSIGAGATATGVTMLRNPRVRVSVKVDAHGPEDGGPIDRSPVWLQLLTVPVTRATVRPVDGDAEQARHDGWFRVDPDGSTASAAVLPGLYGFAVWAQRSGDQPKLLSIEDLLQTGAEPPVYDGVEIDRGFVWIDPSGSARTLPPGSPGLGVSVCLECEVPVPVTAGIGGA